MNAGRGAHPLRRDGRVAVLVAMLAAGLALDASAQPADPDSQPRVRLASTYSASEVIPRLGKLGEQLTYRATVGADTPGKLRVIAPAQEGAFHWGAVRVTGSVQRRARPEVVGPGAWAPYAKPPAVIEVPLQVFALGEVSVPGLEIEVDDGTGVTRHRLPTAQVSITPLIDPSDSTADLRALLDPLAAPWYERVPWRWVVAAVVLIGAVIALIVWLKRRRRRVVSAPAPAAPARRVDPSLDALRELDALRRRGLPANGQFDEHALHLTRIVRRYLEAIAGRTLPGDTTPEVIRHLEGSRLEPEELRQLDGLLRLWDRLKFAQAQSSPEECARAEGAVEALIRRHAATSAGAPATDAGRAA